MSDANPFKNLLIYFFTFEKVQHKKIVCFLFFSLFLFSNLFGQINIRGKITDSSSRPISSASVTLENNRGNIISFSISNIDGDFIILSNLPFLKKTYLITVNALGYIPVSIELNQADANLSIDLRFSTNELPNIIVKTPRPRIKFKADTLSYKVDSFANEQDRSIGDVLKRLPGIEVDISGAIKYNGKSISNLYLDGDDLLNDKYNLITNTVKAKMVNEVQVLENHFPIKVLRNSVGNDKVALNLSLKDSATLKWASDVNLGVGVSNHLNYDENLQSLLLKKKHKVINALKINNSGVDLGNEIISHNISEYQQNLKKNNISDLLSLNTPPNPVISKQRYLFNNVALGTTNNFFRTKKDIEIRTNLYYLVDQQTQDYRFQNSFFFPSDTINFIQNQQTTSKTNTAFGEISVTKNHEKIFISNKLSVEHNRTIGEAFVKDNRQFNQNLHIDHTNLSNDFNIIKNLGKSGIIEFFSHSSYLNKPATLNFRPGINEPFFNSNIPYLELVQKADVKTHFIHNFFTYRRSIGKVQSSYQIGLISQEQFLKTNLSSVQLDGSRKNPSDSFLNEIKLCYTNLYAESNFDFLIKKAIIKVKLPISSQTTNYFNPYNTSALNFKSNVNFFTPSISIKVPIGIENNLIMGYGYNNTLGNIEDVFQGYILRNFNLLSTNILPLKENNIQNITFGFQHRKTTKALFFNVFANYSTVNSNGIINNSITDEIQKQVLIPLNNQFNSFSISSVLSKYFFKLNTNSSLKLSMNNTNLVLLQNNILQTFINSTKSISGTINPKINDFINFAYNFSFSNSKSLDNANKKVIQTVSQTVQSGEINATLNKILLIRLKGESTYIINKISNGHSNFLFFDMNILYKLNKKKMDISLDIYNLSNNTNYEVLAISANNISRTSYLIRPRMVMLKFSFQI
jgi:hypothetical protein